MIISNKNRYVFLATPRTASTAIISELIKSYDGISILEKHSNYHEFFRYANKDQKNYFVFAGIRHPLDETVSLYEKLRTNHEGAYTNLNEWVENGGWVTKRMRNMFKFVNNPKNDFFDFLQKYYRFPYSSRIDINAKYCDYIIRYETINEDFTEVLNKIRLKKKRNLPIINKTREKKNFWRYFDNKKILKYCLKIFGPYMEKWGYEFNNDHKMFNYLSNYYRIFYKIIVKFRAIHSRMVSYNLQNLIDSMFLISFFIR